MDKYILSCDWGSTAFRLRLIEMPAQKIVGEVSSDDGVTRTFNLWKANAADKGITRKQFFIGQLKKQKDNLAAQLSMKLDGITIIVSGMASSSIGMQELPYALLPFATDGSDATVQFFEAEGNFPNPIILISGVRSEEEVMRGEETQLVGISQLLGLHQQEAILILPGTHSKHLYVKDGQLVNFKTFMTGELFGLMVSHSILKDSVDITGTTELTGSGLEAFKLGLNKATEFNILNALFTVRTNQLFNKLNKKDNACYLSGLLIGTEIKRLNKKDGIPLILCGAGNLYELYKLAMEEFGLLTRTIIISAESIHNATIAGQVIIYQKQTANQL